MILNWCQTGTDITAEHITERIGDCKSIEHLLSLYKMFPQFQGELKPEFEQRKRELVINTSNHAKEELILHRTGAEDCFR